MLNPWGVSSIPPMSHVGARARATVAALEPTAAWQASPLPYARCSTMPYRGARTEMQCPAAAASPVRAHSGARAFLRALGSSDFEREFLHPERPGAPWRLGESVLHYAWHGRHHTAQILAALARGD